MEGFAPEYLCASYILSLRDVSSSPAIFIRPFWTAMGVGIACLRASAIYVALLRLTPPTKHPSLSQPVRRKSVERCRSARGRNVPLVALYVLLVALNVVPWLYLTLFVENGIFIMFFVLTAGASFFGLLAMFTFTPLAVYPQSFTVGYVPAKSGKQIVLEFKRIGGDTRFILTLITAFFVACVAVLMMTFGNVLLFSFIPAASAISVLHIWQPKSMSICGYARLALVLEASIAVPMLIASASPLTNFLTSYADSTKVQALIASNDGSRVWFWSTSLLWSDSVAIVLPALLINLNRRYELVRDVSTLSKLAVGEYSPVPSVTQLPATKSSALTIVSLLALATSLFVTEAVVCAFPSTRLLYTSGALASVITVPLVFGASAATAWLLGESTQWWAYSEKWIPESDGTRNEGGIMKTVTDEK